MENPKTLDEVKNYALGEWQSLSVELRPTEDRTRSGKIEPTYLKRNFCQKNKLFLNYLVLSRNEISGAFQAICYLYTWQLIHEHNGTTIR